MARKGKRTIGKDHQHERNTKKGGRSEGAKVIKWTKVDEREQKTNKLGSMLCKFFFFF